MGLEEEQGQLDTLQREIERKGSWQYSAHSKNPVMVARSFFKLLLHARHALRVLQLNFSQTNLTNILPNWAYFTNVEIEMCSIFFKVTQLISVKEQNLNTSLSLTSNIALL